MSEPLYHPGMGDALGRLERMDEAALLAVLDTLYGRDNLKYGDGREELLAEARRQVREDFTNMHPDAVAERESLAKLGSAIADAHRRERRAVAGDAPTNARRSLPLQVDRLQRLSFDYDGVGRAVVTFTVERDRNEAKADSSAETAKPAAVSPESPVATRPANDGTQIEQRADGAAR